MNKVGFTKQYSQLRGASFYKSGKQMLRSSVPPHGHGHGDLAGIVGINTKVLYTVRAKSRLRDTITQT